nr:hypothetical protein [Tanacetum cinerariifolium]
MAALKYKEEHNKVGYLIKPTGSDDYHQIIDFFSGSHIRGMVNNIGNAKKFLMYPRFLQTILGKGAEVAAQDVPHPVPAPKTAAGSIPTTEDAPLGGNLHPSRPQSSHAPPAGQPSGGEEDPITLTALSFVVLTLVQKVHSLEAKLHDHKKLFKDVVGKLVKKVKSLEVKLKTKKRKLVISDSDPEDSTTQDMDLDALRALANAAVAADLDIPSGNTLHVPSAIPPGASSVAPGASGVTPAIPANSPKVPAGASSKGKSPMVEEDIPVTARSFRQREEDRLEDNTNDLASSDSGLKSSEHKPTDSSGASTSSVSTSVNGDEIDLNTRIPTKEPIIPTGEPKATSIPTGKPKGTPVLTGKPTVHPVPTGKPKFTLVPTGRLHRPFPVATDRGCSPSVPSGWWSHTAAPFPYLFNPTSSYFQPYTPYVPTEYYNHMQYGGDR